MKTNKAQLEKRINLVQIGFILNVVLVLFVVWQFFFEDPENFRKPTHWIVLILWTIVSILNWFHLKALKKELKKESQIGENPMT